MTTAATLDLSALLARISDESPTGRDLRRDASPLSTYQTIKTARYAARDAEKNNLYKEANGEADEYWRKILDLAPALITRESKDLEVASWLTEALIRKNGFHGLSEALSLINGLIEHFWEHIFPLPDDEDGLETRLAPIVGLNGEGGEGVLIAPIRRASLTEGYAPGPFAYWQYQQAVEIERITDDDLRISKKEKLGFSMSDIENAIDESSQDFIVNQLKAIQASIKTSKDIENRLDHLCGSANAPSMRAIVNALEECHSALNHLAKHKLPIAEEPSIINDEASAAELNSGAKTTQSAIRKIDSRESALQQLLEIAKFFRKAEPHSPVSYALEKAVKWANMPLDELIVELIPDASSRSHFSLLTGVANKED